MPLRQPVRRFALAAGIAILMTGIGTAPLYAVDGKDTPKAGATNKKAKKQTAAPRDTKPQGTTAAPSGAMSGYRNDYNVGNGY